MPRKLEDISFEQLLSDIRNIAYSRGIDRQYRILDDELETKEEIIKRFSLLKGEIIKKVNNVRYIGLCNGETTTETFKREMIKLIKEI